MDPLNQPGIPIYLDTSALWRERVIMALRAQFPTRSLCVPTVAHFEWVRQLRFKYRDDFDEREIRSFIETHGLTLVDFTSQAADLVAQMACRVEENGLSWKPQWPEKYRNVDQHPCGQRCRLGDYTIAATAKVGNGLLLTSDREMFNAFNGHPDLFPIAISPDDVAIQV
jgi:predicted nucleic acid-binding protein